MSWQLKENDYSEHVFRWRSHLWKQYCNDRGREHVAAYNRRNVIPLTRSAIESTRRYWQARLSKAMGDV